MEKNLQSRYINVSRSFIRYQSERTSEDTLTILKITITYTEKWS